MSPSSQNDSLASVNVLSGVSFGRLYTVDSLAAEAGRPYEAVVNDANAQDISILTHDDNPEIPVGQLMLFPGQSHHHYVAGKKPNSTSADNKRLTQSEKRKRVLGQFFTENDCWLQPQVLAFIQMSQATEIYDPFAGSGCILKAVEHLLGGFSSYIGLDIDSRLAWEQNDSLVSIPPRPSAIIVTNPPYLSSYSASRKQIRLSTAHYFRSTSYDDLYLLALDKMLEASSHVVAIIPETFINSPYRQKERLHSLTILEQNPFLDTDTPVLVACFDSHLKPLSEVPVFKGDLFVTNLGEVENCRIFPDNSLPVVFNDPTGWLGVRCVDTTNPDETLKFEFKDNISYDWDAGIKVSSRLITLISVDVSATFRSDFVHECNRILSSLRQRSHDLIFSPFKGNMKNGIRRRRLDFMTCRAILERAYKTVMSKRSNTPIQQVLF